MRSRSETSEPLVAVEGLVDLVEVVIPLNPRSPAFWRWHLSPAGVFEGLPLYPYECFASGRSATND